MIDRSDWIVEKFSFLISEYDFVVIKKEFDSQAMGNVIVTFVSPDIGLEIVIDRDQVLICVGDPKELRSNWIDFSYLLKFFSPSDVAYIDISSLFIEERKKHFSNMDAWERVIEIQLVRLSQLLHDYIGLIKSRKLDVEFKEEVIENFYIHQKNYENI